MATSNAAMPSTASALLRRDRWMLPTVQALLAPPAFARVASADGSYWDAASSEGVAPDVLVAALARRHRLCVADLSVVSGRARELIPEATARRYGIVPLAADETSVDVATSDPHDLDAEQALAFAAGRAVRFQLAAPSAIAERLEELFRTGSPVERILDGVASRFDAQPIGDAADEGGAELDAERAGERPVIGLVDHILTESIAVGASDIHLEPGEGAVLVRQRVDGVLREAMRLPRGVGVALVSRVKIIAGLDIADRLRPQDGRARVAVGGAPIDLRVSTIPATHGEKVVVRVLDARSTLTSLDDLGLAPRERARLDRLVGVREGLVLVTGPTGSGKTTTLYAALRQTVRDGVNVVTVEDPVEYRLPGATQVQVNPRAGLGFAEALRSILRQDPDVVLVGEIRDRETAATAAQAALTGHLVFSTLHTLDSASAVTRLLDLGLERYALAAALKGVVAQRLVRRLCASCAVASVAASPPILRPALAGRPVRDAVGCRDCRGTGFRGRLAVVELLVVSDAVERAIAEGASAADVAAAARAGGMRSLWDAGVEHVARGETTARELLRVLQPPVGAEDAEPQRHRALPAASPFAFVSEPPPRARRANGERVATGGGAMTDVRSNVVEVYVLRGDGAERRVLALQRAASGTRCPDAWEAVAGHVEGDERPPAAAVREIAEETGLAVARLYTVTVQQFYLHGADVVQSSIVFAAFAEEGEVRLGPEHQRAEWLTFAEASERFTWPRAVEALAHIERLLPGRDAGPVEDVLRVR